jgi:hypothetical protein
MLARAARTIARFLAKSQPPFVIVRQGFAHNPLAHREASIPRRRVAFSKIAGNNRLGDALPGTFARGKDYGGF